MGSGNAGIDFEHYSPVSNEVPAPIEAVRPQPNSPQECSTPVSDTPGLLVSNWDGKLPIDSVKMTTTPCIRSEKHY